MYEITVEEVGRVNASGAEGMMAEQHLRLVITFKKYFSFNFLTFHLEIISELQKDAKIVQRIPMCTSLNFPKC